jgi:2-haloacid dehalogenase
VVLNQNTEGYNFRKNFYFYAKLKIMATIKTIIFDLGGVLIDWNPDYVFKNKKVIPDPEWREYFFTHVCPYSWNVEQDAGRTFADATNERVAEFPEWEAEIRAYYGRWEEMLGGPIQPTVDVLKALLDSKLYKVLALTNWSHESFPTAQRLYDFLGWFDGIVVSGTEKTRKPFLPIYQILLDRYAVEPTTAVFIDDSLPNVEAARSLGIHGIHFQSAAQLQLALKDLGVVI